MSPAGGYDATVTGEIIFTHRALLWGVAAAVAPILIHLLLRPRPRRARFPAVTLLRAALVSGQRANRVRNALLMAVRMLLLAVAALLLAAPTCAPHSSDPIGAQPVACILVLDDSASMGYQLDGKTPLLKLARDRAVRFVQQSAAWSEGSTLTLLTAGRDGRAASGTTDRAVIVKQLQSLDLEAPHAEPLGAALHAAGELLRSAEQPARRLVVFTDGAAHAWRDVTPAALAGIDRLGVRVAVPRDDRRSNLAVLGAAAPPRLHPSDAPVPVRVTLAAAGVESDCWLLVQQGQRTLRRVGPVHIPAGDRRELYLELAPLPVGPHALTLQLDPPDRLDCDQRRYVAVQTAPRPHVWLVTSSEDDLSAVILRNLLAPEALPVERQLVEVRTIKPEHLAGALAGVQQPRQPDAPAFVILLCGAELPTAGLQALLRHVERGASLLLIPPAAGEDADWPGIRQLLTSGVPVDEPLTALATIRWERTSPYAGGEELAELTRCAVRRRLRLNDVRTEVVVHARYADGQPAIVAKRLGSGRVLLLSTSPAPQWSDLGIRAAGLLTWLHRLIDEALGPPGAIGAFTVGDEPRRPFADLPATGLTRVSLHGDASRPPAWIRLSENPLRQPWPAARPGIYEAWPAAGGDRRAVYVVNWPAEESELSPITLPQLRECVGLEDVQFDAADDDRATRPASLVARLLSSRDGRRPLGALLLAAFALELLLGARRGRRAGQPAQESAEPFQGEQRTRPGTTS